MSLSRISFSLGSSLLLASVLALVLASLVKTRLKGATSRLAHLGKFNLNISSSSFVIRVNLLHPKPSLNLYGLLSSIWCFSILVNYYFQVFFNLRVTLYVVKISQNAVTKLL